MDKVKINTEFIKLNQLLKWVNVVDSGGAANHMIEEGLVKVNGDLETRKGRKIHTGDIVEVEQMGSFLIE
ncbi:MAG TPA: RNA-binding protein [Clostridiales bacterium]|nr:RNA-binding S4 domain-containing protein [Clostridia bacterium]MDD4679415.1 RNA-binding S4 domain-containing protein [Clostridia bacterium]HCS72959.1 RNA-binding protein [Clostridiales bacterium]